LPWSLRVLTQRCLQLPDHILEFARIFGGYGPGDESVDAVLEATLWQAVIRTGYYRGSNGN